MYHKQLVEHILHKRSSGISDDDIRLELSQDEWTKEDIDKSFQYAQSPEKLKHFSIKRALDSEVKASYFVVVFKLTICLSISPFVYSSTKNNDYTVVVTNAPGHEKTIFKYGVQEAMSKPDFFNKVKNQFIEIKASFIEVDLTRMVVRVYKNGTSTLEVPIKTKGRSGSWWETPAGLYKIETREKTHYSTMGHVTQPWSMQFQGNFFIHGIPYYDDGTPVASTFSGGCVRLVNEDAKKVFDTVTVGTPILVYEKDFIPDDFSYTEAIPEIKAKSFLFADINNNFVFLKKNDSQVVPIGSITKLMTALIATEYINIEKTTTVQKEALIETTPPRLQAGMKIDIYQLLFPLLRESSNEAGEAIAQSYGKREFIKHMNEKAKAIGMTHTTFVDPTGISKDNISSAEDIFMLAKYIYNNRSFIFNITSGKVKTNTYGESIFNDLGYNNNLSGEKYFFGGIVDERDSVNQNNLSVLEIKIGEIIRPIFFVSLGSGNAKKDIESGLEYTLRKWK